MDGFKLLFIITYAYWVFRQIVDLNVGELQMYGTVNWVNASDEVGKLKKGADLLTLVFIFKSAIVLLAQERTKAKKKLKVGKNC